MMYWQRAGNLIRLPLVGKWGLSKSKYVFYEKKAHKIKALRAR